MYMRKSKVLLAVVLLAGLTHTVNADDYLETMELETLVAEGQTVSQQINSASSGFPGMRDQQHFETFLSNDHTDIYMMYKTLEAQHQTSVFELSTWDGVTVDDIHTAVAALYIHAQGAAPAFKNS
jgi:hypothetical protein